MWQRWIIRSKTTINYSVPPAINASKLDPSLTSHPRVWVVRNKRVVDETLRWQFPVGLTIMKPWRKSLSWLSRLIGLVGWRQIYHAVLCEESTSYRWHPEGIPNSCSNLKGALQQLHSHFPSKWCNQHPCAAYYRRRRNLYIVAGHT